MLPVGLFSGVVLYLAYEKWRKKLPPEPLPIQSLDRFARMMEEGMSIPIKVPAPTPPVKGSFPLDHEGQCRYEMLKYMLCLNEHKQKSDECRDFAKIYLKCRMDNGLMQQEEWKYLGFSGNDET
uniref:CHCH domain-containing protein n=1 Tax=Setaria digitata TaxID=48799 RepID=A0A915Q7Y9_9BILA